MGSVYAEITLKNAHDLMRVKDGLIKEKEIRETVEKALVDTGAWTLVINEDVREKLGLDVRGERIATMANGMKEMVKMAEPVEVHWKSRSMTCQPILIPGTDEVLLGAIPLEDMDLIVDPQNEVLVGRHGDKIINRV